MMGRVTPTSSVISWAATGRPGEFHRRRARSSAIGTRLQLACAGSGAAWEWQLRAVTPVGAGASSRRDSRPAALESDGAEV